jgi:hypothetical protein
MSSLTGSGIVSRERLPADGEVAALASSVIHALIQVAATSQTSREPLRRLPARRSVGQAISILGRSRYVCLTRSNTSLTIVRSGIVAGQEPHQRSG